MFKHLQKLLLIVAFCVPWVTQAQVTCDSGDPDTVTNLPAGVTASSTSSYFPGYSLYNYSYTEVIIPSSQLEDGGITEIKGLMFKPASTSAGSYFTNCTIYLANTTVSSLASSFITDVSDYEQVFAGSLNYSSTNWQTVEFDDSFTWDGSSNIVVAVKRDHGSWTSGSSFTAFNAGSSLGRYVYTDSGPYTPGSVSGGTSTSTVAWYKLLGCSGDPVDCNRVRNLAVSNILSDEVTLSWIDTVNSGATYTIYAIASDTTVVVANLSTNTYTITDLDPNTVYTFAVVADCGNDGESVYSKVTVRTACAPMDQLPFTYGFEDAQTGTSATFPSCWTRINDATGTYNYYPYVYTSNAHSGSKSLYWYLSTTSTYAENEYVILPQIDGSVYDVSELTLSFWAGSTSISYNPVFVVGVMDDPTDVTTFVAVDTVDNIINEWLPYAVNFEDYTGTGTYVAIKAYRPASAWYAVMDDITLIESIDFCAPVSNLADSAGINDVTVTWDGDETGTYLVILDGVDTVEVTGTSYTFDNLDANTAYTYSVAQLCADTSDFLYGITHTLAGEPINVFPYTCGFEIDIDNEIDEASDWVLENGTQTNYWMVGGATNNGGSRSLYITNNGTANSYTNTSISYSYAYAAFQFDAGEYAFSYDWKGMGESHNYDFSRVFVVPTSESFTAGTVLGGSTYSFSTAAAPAGWIDITQGGGTPNTLAQSNSWQTVTGTFNISTAGIYKLVFVWANDGSGGDNPPTAIDNIYVNPNTCPQPSNFAVTVNDTTGTADFSWTDPNSQAWELVYGSRGFNPNDATDVEYPTTTTYQINNLDTGFYDAYIRTNCGNDDYSLWVGPVTFNYGINIMNMATSGSDTIYTCAAVIYDDGGATGSYSSSCQSTLVIYPSTPGSEVVITGTSYTESSYDYLTIYQGVGTSGEQLWTDNGVTAQQSFGPFSADAITIVFHSDGSVEYDGFEINVACSAPSSCPKPTHFTVSSVQVDSVALNWEDPADASNFELCIGTPGFNPDTVSDPIVLTDTSYVFNNLVGGVTYEVYVRTNCGSEYSNWNGPLSFVPGQYIIGTSGAATISMCGGVIYDDGGPNGQYSNYVDYTLTVYPSSADSMLTFHGSAYTESSIDYLKIYEGVGTNGSILWQTSNSSQLDNIPLTTVMTGPITLQFHSDGSVVYSGFELYVNCIAAPECAAVENLSVTTGPASAVATWDEGFFGEYTGATVEYKELGDSSWTTLPPVTSTYALITGLTPNTTYNLRVTTDCNGFSGNSATTNFTTGRFPCLIVDSSTVVNVIDTIGQRTTTNNYFPSYSFYNYSLTQQIYTPDEIGHAGTINSLAFMMSTVNQQRTYEIYMGHTSNATATQFINPSDLTCVYNGGAVNMVANQWTTFTFTTPFYYNGTDNLVIFFRDMTGSYVSGNYGYGFTGTSGVSRYIYQDSGPYTVGSTSGGTTSSFRNALVLGTTDYGCLLSDSCAAPVAAVANVTTTSVDVVWAPGYVESSWNVYYRQAGETTWSAPVAVTTTNYSFTNLNSGMPYEFKIEGECNNNTLSTVLGTTTLCAAISTLPYTEDFNNWGTGVLPNCWYNTGAYSTTNYSIISGSQNMSGTTGGSIYMYSSSSANYISRIIMPALDTNVYQANQTQVVFNVKYTSTSYGVPTFTIGVMDDPNDISTFVPVTTVQHSGTINIWEPFEVPLDNYTGNGAHIAIQTLYPGTYFYCYLDNVTLELIPTCPRPDSLMASNATNNSVDLSWHERGGATNWIIEYGPRGFALGTGTTVAVSTNPYTLQGLSAGYQGEFYVRSVCSSNDTGDFSRMPGNFDITQVPATLPYDYNFEDAAEWANWQTCSNVTTNWYRGNAVASNSTSSMYISADQGATYNPYLYNAVVNAAAYRDIDFGPVQNSFTISFDARVGGTISASYDGLMVFLVDPSIPTVASNSNITSPWGNVNDLYRIATVRLDTTWNTYTASFDTISGVKRVAFFWFNQNTTSYANLPEPAAIDNIHIAVSACPRPVGLSVDNVGGSTASLSWNGPAQATYQVIYRPYPNGTSNSYATTNTNSITLTGLEPMTQYAAWVRKICGNDTSLTCDGELFTTEMCDNGVVAFNYDTTMTTASTTYAPIGYSLYNYSYVQTIFDSAFLAQAGIVDDITAFGFNVNDPSTGGDRFDNMNVWLANVSESDLSAGPIIPNDSNHVFVKVIDNTSFSFGSNTGWMLHGFDTAFTWDGHSNILISVQRNNGSYSGSTSFHAHNTTGVKTRYYYQDGGSIDPMSPSASSSNSLSLTGDIQLISCGGTSCQKPSALNATDVTYNSATVNWFGNATTFEISVKAANEGTWPAETTVNNATSFTFTGLLPETMYNYRVRAICDATEGLISDWATGSFTTDELPCFAPTDVTATPAYDAVTVNWTPGTNETMWNVRIWNSAKDTNVTVTAHPAVIGGLAQTTTYNVAVQALCGNGAVESDFSDTLSFTTLTCAPVSGVSVSNVTNSSATVTWNGTAQSYDIEYGDHGFGQGQGTKVNGITAQTYTLQGLDPEAQYDVYVRANCDANNASDWSPVVSFTTTAGEGINTADGMNVTIFPNPTSTSTTISLSGVSGDVQISIVDMNGRTVMNETMSCDGSCTKQMEVSGLASGAYFVRVSGEGVNMVKKLVVK